MKTIFSAAAVVAACSVVAWATAIPSPVIEERPLEVGARPPARADTTALAAATMRLRLRNPFRLDRKPTAVRYNPWEPVIANAPPPPPPVRPPLALAGLVGPPWNALVEGIPGREGGVLLQVGDSVNGIRFVALRGDTVLLAGYDTTWSLTARRTWH